MKTGELIKASRFNYSSEDKEGNLLLCNFATGPYSFSKIMENNKDKYYNIIANENLVYDDENNHIIDLCDRGYLIPDYADEDLRVKAFQYEATINNTLMITILPTEQCNFRCKYCYETFKKGKMTKESQNAVLKFIQKRLMHTTDLNISWFGGEPLEALDVIEYIMENTKKICDNRKNIYTSNMTTNGYGLEPEILDKLYKWKIYGYQITIDGLKEQHDNQRVKEDGSGTFDKIINNLIYIKNNTQYKLLKIDIRINVTSDILDNLEEFLEFYRVTFDNDKRFNLRLYPAGDLGGDRVESIKSKFVDRYQISKKMIECGLYDSDDINLSDDIKYFYPMQSMCYAAKKNSFVIGSDLEVYKCTVHFDMYENKIGKIAPNGDLHINEHLHNKWYMKSNESEQCKTCFYLPCCNCNGCPVKTNFIEQNIKGCYSADIKNNLNNYIQYLSMKIDFKIIDFI